MIIFFFFLAMFQYAVMAKGVGIGVERYDEGKVQNKKQVMHR